MCANKRRRPAHDEPVQRRLHELVEATIKVARGLNFRAVAEGIETAGQAEMLRAMACDKGQGYLFARPLQVDAFEAWLRQR
ncbi:EAL domain-containing protein [Pseudorhodoferax sp. LjRoot39]|uniref:EAL domain-containing protein n=1 Tax=Pseudorhodoferax sp. LjRoot39 TaxID=3342328 RepID=UPI003ED0D9FD